MIYMKVPPSFTIQLTNRQLNKLIWRIKHMMNGGIELLEWPHWSELQNILEIIR
jgi:hypothetical protein